MRWIGGVLLIGLLGLTACAADEATGPGEAGPLDAAGVGAPDGAAGADAAGAAGTSDDDGAATGGIDAARSEQDAATTPDTAPPSADAAASPDAALDAGPDAPAPPGAARLAINEIVASTVDGSPDWIELVVVGDAPVDLAGWTLVDDAADHSPAPLPAGTLEPGSFLVVIAADEAPAGGAPWVPFKLGKDDAVTLARDGEAVETLDWQDGEAPAGAAWGRLPDGTGEPQLLAPTPGAPNQALDHAPPTSPWIPDRVVSVELILADADWQAMTADPLAEEYVPGTLVFDGLSLPNIAVRTKGNSSLKSVAQKGGTHRFSFKVDTNRLVAGQSLLGSKKLNFNNGFKDPTLLREHLAYALAREAGIPAPRTTFVDLTIGGEHLGLYLMVEHVDDDFLADHFPPGDGTLYKPEPPAGNLGWQGEDPAKYPGLEVKQNPETDHAAFMALVTALKDGDAQAIEAALDVDATLLQLAFHTLLVNLDSYLGPGHNYYLVETEGHLAMIPWDLNEAFGSFTCSCDRAGIIGLRIDEPTCGALASKPLVDALLKEPAWRDAYHAHLQAFVDGLFAPAAMQARIDAAAALVRPTVESSPTLFYPVASFEKALTQDVGQGPESAIGLMAFVTERGAAVQAQLDGASPSTNGGAGSCKSAGGGGGPPKPCGDGVCDPFEQANPGVCPLDCG